MKKQALIEFTDSLVRVLQTFFFEPYASDW